MAGMSISVYDDSIILHFLLQALLAASVIILYAPPFQCNVLNCDFRHRRQNCIFYDFAHPHFGMIKGVFAVRDIKAGEELFVDYAFKPAAFPSDFPWYHKAKKE